MLFNTEEILFPTFQHRRFILPTDLSAFDLNRNILSSVIG